MKKPAFLAKAKTTLLAIPRKAWVVGGVLVGVVTFYSLVFFVPKPVDFSYANASCVSQLLLAPDLQKTNSPEFDIIIKDKTAIGSVALFSTKLCVEPKSAPKEGSHTVAVAPFGGPIAAKRLKLKVSEPPQARATDFIDKTIPTARPLTIGLSAPDQVYAYSLKVGEKATRCPQKDNRLVCDITGLDLEQGAQYPVALRKSFKAGSPVVIKSGTVTTHVPLQNTEASIKDGYTAYDMPKDFTFKFDKPLSSVKAALQKAEGDTLEDIKLTVAIDGQSAVLSTANDLPRRSSFKLTITEALAEDGSSLQDPIVLNFSTSGGPKVSSISVGGGSVAPNAQIILTFDQPLAESLDITKLIRTTGVASAVRKTSPTQVVLALQGAPDCAAFTVAVDKGMKSGSNNETTQEAWAHQSRITCGTSWVIGYSVRGRPITAHSFGSGSTILFTGGIHGNEASTVTTMQAWVQYLQANAGSVLPAGKRVVIVPNVNPDGIAAGSRNNANNVNLGRNFDTDNWKADIETANGVLVNGGGTSVTSEPEAAALAALTRQLRSRLEVSFHSQGRLVGANKFGDSVAIGNTYAQAVGYATMFYNAEAVMGYPMTGEYEDWMGERLGIPAILIELPSHSGNYFSSQLPALKKMLNF